MYKTTLYMHKLLLLLLVSFFLASCVRPISYVKSVPGSSRLEKAGDLSAFVGLAPNRPWIIRSLRLGVPFLQ